MRTDAKIAMTENHIGKGANNGAGEMSGQDGTNVSESEIKGSRSSAKTETQPDRVLIGGNCQVKGEIRHCRRLEVEGQLEGDFETEEFVVRESGKIIGTIKTTIAEIHGTVEGKLIVSELLDVRKSGIVSGDVDYGELVIASGGKLIGNLCTDAGAEKSAKPVKKAETVEINRRGRLRGEDRKLPAINRIINSWMSSGTR